MNKKVIKLSKHNNHLDAADGEHTFNFNSLTWPNITINNTFISLSCLKPYTVM